MNINFKDAVFLTNYDSKLGRIKLVASDKGLIRVSLPISGQDNFEKNISDKFEIKHERNDILTQACKELDEFFSYKRKNFTVPLDIQEGTEFQKQVWDQLQKVPYGKTYSYKKIAELINNPGAVRAIGLANKANPLPLFIPCHRVIGANGALVGFAGNDPNNLKFKSKLLDFEKNKNGILNLLSS